MTLFKVYGPWDCIISLVLNEWFSLSSFPLLYSSFRISEKFPLYFPTQAPECRGVLKVAASAGPRSCWFSSSDQPLVAPHRPPSSPTLPPSRLPLAGLGSTHAPDASRPPAAASWQSACPLPTPRHLARHLVPWHWGFLSSLTG